MMRCAECHRGLIKPAYTAPATMGGWVLGPVCLTKAGLQLAKKPRPAAARLPSVHRVRAAKPVKRPYPLSCLVLEGQLSLFEPVTAPALAQGAQPLKEKDYERCA